MRPRPPLILILSTIEQRRLLGVLDRGRFARYGARVGLCGIAR
jgi:hypothetical protein